MPGPLKRDAAHRWIVLSEAQRVVPLICSSCLSRMTVHNEGETLFLTGAEVRESQFITIKNGVDCERQRLIRSRFAEVMSLTNRVVIAEEHCYKHQPLVTATSRICAQVYASPLDDSSVNS